MRDGPGTDPPSAGNCGLGWPAPGLVRDRPALRSASAAMMS